MQFIERRSVLIIAGITVAYLAMAYVGLLWAVAETNATPFWAPAGIAVASALVFRQPIWPAIVIGAFFANIAHFMQQDVAMNMMIAGSIAVAIGNALEAQLIKYLCVKHFKGNPLDEVLNLVKFIPIVMVGGLVSAAVGTSTMLAMNTDLFLHAPLIFVTWWMGDTLGILVFAPFIISWFLPSEIKLHGKWTELLAAFGILFLLCEMIFFGHISVSQIASRPWWLLPVLLWLVFRFSRREVATAVAIVSFGAIYATAHSKGPFVAATLNESFLSGQLFCAMITVTMLLLSASLTKTARYQLNLKDSNEKLETRVQERTQELEKKTRILEAMNRQLRIEAQERQAAETRLQNLQANNL